MMNDQDLDRLLSALEGEPSVLRLRNVRRSVLVRASEIPRTSFFLFRFEPALFTATALLGLVMGFSLPLIGNSDSASTLFDMPSQSFISGSFG
jgi:hypothetical protein